MKDKSILHSFSTTEMSSFTCSHYGHRGIRASRTQHDMSAFIMMVDTFWVAADYRGQLVSTSTQYLSSFNHFLNTLELTFIRLRRISISFLSLV